MKYTKTKFKHYDYCIERAIDDLFERKQMTDPWLKENVTTAARKGFIGHISKIIDFAFDKPKSTSRSSPWYYNTYHIHTHLLVKFRRNKLGKHFNHIFRKADGSTYHTNSAGYGKKSNAYCNWYHFEEEILYILARANLYLLKDLGFNRMGYKNIDDNECAIPWTDDTFRFNSKEYFKVSKKAFKREIMLFNKHVSPQCLVLIRHARYQDKEYVYFNNVTKSKRELGKVSLGGYGREYSIVGLLKREMRKRLLPGYIEIDIDAAMQTSFLWLITMNPLDKTHIPDPDKLKQVFPKYCQLTGSANEKNALRKQFAKAFSVDIDTAKKILLQLTVAPGSNPARNHCKEKNSLTKKNARKLANEFAREAKVVRDALLKKFYYRDGGIPDDFYIGDLPMCDLPTLIDVQIKESDKGRPNGGKGRSKKDRAMFRIYEAVETQIREEIIRFLNSKGIKEIYQIHDCVILPCHSAKKPLNLVMISEHLQEKFGCRIGCSHEIYNEANRYKDLCAEHSEEIEELRYGTNPAAYLGHGWAYYKYLPGRGDRKFAELETTDEIFLGKVARSDGEILKHEDNYIKECKDIHEQDLYKSF